MESLPSLASQMGQLQLSSGSTGGSSYSGGHQHYPHVAAGATAGSTQATLPTPTHTAHYTAQPPGWTISPTAHYVQQVGSALVPSDSVSSLHLQCVIYGVGQQCRCVRFCMDSSEWGYNLERGRKRERGRIVRE